MKDGGFEFLNAGFWVALVPFLIATIAAVPNRLVDYSWVISTVCCRGRVFVVILIRFRAPAVRYDHGLNDDDDY